MLNIVLRVVLTASFGITKQNYSEVMPKPIELPTRGAGAWLKELPILPCTYLSLAYPWYLLYPELWVNCIVTVLLVVLAGISYAREVKAEIEPLPGTRAFIILMTGVEIFIAVWRVLQFILWRVNGNERVTPLSYYVNQPVAWFNRFGNLDGKWYVAPLAAIVFLAIAYVAFLFMPTEGKVAPKLRWGLVAFFAGFALVIVVGQVVRYTGSGPMQLPVWRVAARDLPRCPHSQLRCGEVCMDLSRDPGNCGACGRACGNGAICTESTCHVVQYQPTSTARSRQHSPATSHGHSRPSARLAANGRRPCSRIGNPANPQDRFRALSARRGLCDRSR